MDEAPKLRLAIVGGGIGGLSLAVALSHLGVDASIQIDLYESAAQLTQIGAGITLWPRGWEVLKNLNLEAPLAALLSPGQEIPTKDKSRPALVFKKSDQPEDVHISDLAFPGGSVSFHRADVLKVLLEHVSPRIQIHLGSRLTSYRKSDAAVELFFKNGATATCDMLVGADGINSIIRRGFLAQEYNLSEEDAVREGRPLWTGTVVYRSIIDSQVIEKLNPKHPALLRPTSVRIIAGKTKGVKYINAGTECQHVVGYPMSGGKQINVVAFFSQPEKEGTFFDGPAVVPQTTDNVPALYANWSDEAKCITDNMINPPRWAIEMVKPLEKYGAGRIALLVDSAHAIPPHLGNGAGQAFEDGYILAHLLSASSASGAPVDTAKVIRVCSAMCQPLGNFVAQASIDQGKNYELASPELADVREGDAVAPERLAALEDRIAVLVRWTWDSSVTDDLERALAMMRV